METQHSPNSTARASRVLSAVSNAQSLLGEQLYFFILSHGEGTELAHSLTHRYSGRALPGKGTSCGR